MSYRYLKRAWKHPVSHINIYIRYPVYNVIFTKLYRHDIKIVTVDGPRPNMPQCRSRVSPSDSDDFIVGYMDYRRTWFSWRSWDDRVGYMVPDFTFASKYAYLYIGIIMSIHVAYLPIPIYSQYVV